MSHRMPTGGALHMSHRSPGKALIAFKTQIEAFGMVLTRDGSAVLIETAGDEKSSDFVLAHRKSGIKGFLRSQIEDGVRASDPDFSYFVAKFYALLGEKDQALSWLEKSSENKDFLMAFVKAEPIFDDLRSEPRYQAVLRHMGLA